MTTAPAEDAAPSRKKCKYTQQLVKIALDEMTQDEVAKLCRVSQSVVSGWLHGRSRAYEHQLVELRKRYGNRLHRATFRVYLAVERVPEASDPHQKEFDWEPYRVRRWTEQVEGFTEPVDEDAEPERTTRLVERTAHEWSASALRVVQVEGPVTLRHVLSRPAAADRRSGRLGREPTGRWIVHHVARERFVLVRQRRRNHHGAESTVWERATAHGIHAGARHPPVDAGDDSARWLSLVVGPCSASELLAHADGAPSSEAGLLGASLLPFLVRKMLLELGYPVDGVERIGPAEYNLPSTQPTQEVEAQLHLHHRAPPSARRRAPRGVASRGPSARWTQIAACLRAGLSGRRARRRESAARPHKGQGRVGPGTSRFRGVPGPFPLGFGVSRVATGAACGRTWYLPPAGAMDTEPVTGESARAVDDPARPLLEAELDRGSLAELHGVGQEVREDGRVEGHAPAPRDRLVRVRNGVRGEWMVARPRSRNCAGGRSAVASVFTLALACSPEAPRAGGDSDTARPSDTGEPALEVGTWTVGEARPCPDPLPEPAWVDASDQLAGAEPYPLPDQTGSLSLVAYEAGWTVYGSTPELGLSRWPLDGTTTPLDPGVPMRAVQLRDLDGDGLAERITYGEGLAVAWGGGSPEVLESLVDGVAVFDIAIADLDGDGDDDLLAAYAQAEFDLTRVGARLFRNEGSSHLAEPEQIGVGDEPFGMAFELTLMDWDHDGDLDAYLCNDFGPELNPNLVMLNDGDGHFTLGDARGADVALYCMGVSVADFDGDGRLDLYEGSIGGHALLLDSAAGFVEAGKALLGAAPTGEQMVWGSAAVDVDNDGRPDLLAATGDFTDGPKTWPLWYLHQAANGRLEPVEAFADVPSGRALLARDLNGDGVVDVLVADAFRPPALHLSTGCTTGAWLQVEAPSGSEVHVTAADRSWVALATDGPGYAASAPSLAHVGVGDVEVIDAVELWVPGVGRVAGPGPVPARSALRWEP